MIDLIWDIVYQALAKFTTKFVDIVHRSKSLIDSHNGFRTYSPTVTQTIVDWELAKDRITCPTNICEVSSKFSSHSIVILITNLGREISIWNDRNCWRYSPYILLQQRTNSNERLIIRGRNQPHIDCTHSDCLPTFCKAGAINFQDLLNYQYPF